MTKTWSPKAIVRLRKRYGETQKEFAPRLGIHPQTLAWWEQGKYKPKYAFCELLARIERDLAAAKSPPPIK